MALLAQTTAERTLQMVKGIYENLTLDKAQLLGEVTQKNEIISSLEDA